MPDQRAETDESQSQATSNIAWFLTGAFIGAAAAILYAPQSGKDTRQYISDKTQQGRDAV
jgi:gas vesicle protein